MIGWYVDVGDFDGIPTTMDEITFRDTHRPLCILENLETSGDYTDSVSIGNETEYRMIGQQLSEKMGDQYNYIYAAYVSRYDKTQDPSNLPKMVAASVNVSFPNFNLARMNGELKPGTCVYFPSIKRGYMYIYTHSTGERLIVFSNTDGALTHLYSKFNIAPIWYCLSVTDESYSTFRVPFVQNYNPEVSWEDNTMGALSLYTVSSNRKAYVKASIIGASNLQYLWVLLGKSEPDFSYDIPPDNPYEPGGPSGPTDPDLPPGTFDDESDTIPDSSLPTLSAANTGFTRIYNPTLSQVQALARYLWTDPDVIQTIWNHIKQFFENPMEAIIGFNLVPVPVPDGGTENFALMYIDTGVSMTVAANQFVDLDCGIVELKRYYGSALDQSPYTKVSCFLPYIGTVNLNTDEVMGTTLQVKYRVDIVSGSCVAKIFVDGNCLYQYSGHCAITIPISSADFSSYVSAAISVGKLAAAAITAGAGAAMAAGVAEASQQTNQVVTTTQVTNTTRNPSTGRQITTGTTTTVQTRESPADQYSTQASFSGLSPQNVANTVGVVMSSKPHIEHSGSFSGNSGYMGVRRPFLIIERPNMCMPANYQALNGFPAMITMELSTCKGFTRVQQVQLTGMGRATNPEQAEILELLKSGVIL